MEPPYGFGVGIVLPYTGEVLELDSGPTEVSVPEFSELDDPGGV